MKFGAILVALALTAGSALAQEGRRHEGKQRQMSQEQRRQMREDVREAYRQRQARPDRPRQMSPEEREKLRRDIESANKGLRRK
jgi:hypothetical protein